MKQINKSNCDGCENNFYNGNNPYGIKECWSFKTAKLVFKKQVHMDQIPPWNQKPIKVPDCYHMKHYVFVGEELYSGVYN